MSSSTTHAQAVQSCSDASPSPSVRRSLRGVKKKKLDDGMVDSAMIGSRRHLQPSDRKTIELDSLSSAGSSLTSLGSPASLAKARTRTRKCHSTSKALRQRSIPPTSLNRSFTMKDANGWQPTDDLALICATNDLVAVHRLVAFSSKFSLSEIETRWYDLLYDPVTSRLAQERMQSLKPEVVKEIESSTPFSDTENRCLASISSTVQPSFETLADAMENHKDTFFHGRTPASLQKQWLNLKKHDLLEECKNSGGLHSRDHRRNPAFGSVPFNSSSRLNGEVLISRSDAERSKLPVAVEHLPDAGWSVSPSTLAILRGRVVQYLIRTPEVVLGHGGMYPFYGVDLSCEGPCWKIGQRQAVIRWRSTGEWWLSNEGHTPVTIDGLPCVSGAKAKLSSNSVVEICQIRLLFIDVNSCNGNTGHTDTNTTDSLVA
ncbi:MCRS N domain containing protein [Trichuris trichiura]|uniref:MCRS N domain containing protein n=1 Tax=Trichuris trichiura TaxID=36087 RepID=A0A077Z1V1_TRITR|nr:MCRS N domain containing protein [Trichuris trichiura]